MRCAKFDLKTGARCWRAKHWFRRHVYSSDWWKW